MWTGAFAIVITELYCFVERLENNARHFNMAEQILVQQNVPTVYRHTIPFDVNFSVNSFTY